MVVVRLASFSSPLPSRSSAPPRLARFSRRWFVRKTGFFGLPSYDWVSFRWFVARPSLRLLKFSLFLTSWTWKVLLSIFVLGIFSVAFCKLLLLSVFGELFATVGFSMLFLFLLHEVLMGGGFVSDLVCSYILTWFVS